MTTDQTNPELIQLARDLRAARQGIDRAALRRIQRAAKATRQKAATAQALAHREPTFENEVAAMALQLLVAAIDLAEGDGEL